MPADMSRRRLLAGAGAAALGLALPAARAAPRVGDAAQIDAIAALREQAVLLKAGGHALSRSDDGGRTWREVPLALPRATVIGSLAVSAGPANAIYAAGPRVGVLRVDGHRALSRGLPSGITAVTAHARQADTVYAYAPGRGIYRSDDGGAKWRLMDAGPRGGITQFVHSDMPGSMQTGWLFAAGPQGVRLSMDCFCGWRSVGELPGGAAQAIACDPHRPARVVAAVGDLVFESGDGAQTWSTLLTPGAPAKSLAIASDGTVYASTGSRLLRRTATGWSAVDA